MCGLFGFQYAKDTSTSPQERTLVALFLAKEAESRGRHACGYAGYDAETNALEVYKEDHGFSGSDMLLPIALQTNALGHTRYATVGAQNAKNAHPFDIGDIVGAHNGGIHNHGELKKKYKKRKDFDVDSMHLIAHIDEDRDCRELTGYGAVSWMDKRMPGHVFLCKMRQGDLHVERLANKQGIVWGSTVHIVSSALNVVSWYRDSRNVHLKEGMVYVVKDGEIYESDKTIELGGSGYRGRGQVWKGGSWHERDDDTTTTTTTTPTTPNLSVVPPRTPQTYGPFASQAVKAKNEEVIGSVSRATTPPSTTEGGTPCPQDTRGTDRQCSDEEDTYNAACEQLEHYQRGVAFGTSKSLGKTLRPHGDGVILDTEELLNLIKATYEMTPDEEDIAVSTIIDMTRRARRGAIGILTSTAGHREKCLCDLCLRSIILVDALTSNGGTGIKPRRPQGTK